MELSAGCKCWRCHRESLDIDFYELYYKKVFGNKEWEHGMPVSFYFCKNCMNVIDNYLYKREGGGIDA